LFDDGTTAVLTTQYLEEADQLAHRIGVINHGRLIGEGTPEQLKDRAGGSVLQLSILDTDGAAAMAALHDVDPEPATYDPQRGTLTLPARHGVDTLRAALHALDNARITPTDVGLHKPTLDDVFLALTRPGGSGLTLSTVAGSMRRAGETS
jgi:ABC-2 type transport system ATP-binding protein